MRASRKTVSAFVFGALVGLGAAACQTYDFEPVDPISLARQDNETIVTARNLKPNVMLLVDKSGSMDLPVDSSVSACQQSDGTVCGEGGDSLCPSNCPTRWTDLQSAMQQFLQGQGNSTQFLRLGLTTFPHPEKGGSCAPSQSVLVDLANSDDGTALQSHAGDVWTNLSGIKMVDTTSGGPDRTGGGTPTALSVRYLRDNVATLNGAAEGRQGFVILLTDGLPNCNPNHAPYDATKPEQCICTLSSCTISGYESLGCLDQEGSVAEITALRQANVKTIVVGFGAETSAGPGPGVLRAMAIAGGYERTCTPATVATDCGTGQTCDNNLCSEPYFQAANGAQLAAALAKIASDIQLKDPCTFRLDTQPTDPSLLSVRVNDVRVPATNQDGSVNWSYQSPDVVFAGPVCEQIKSSTSANPVKVVISVVQSR